MMLYDPNSSCWPVGFGKSDGSFDDFIARGNARTSRCGRKTLGQVTSDILLVLLLIQSDASGRADDKMDRVFAAYDLKEDIPSATILQQLSRGGLG
jgi:hypothetical protein